MRSVAGVVLLSLLAAGCGGGSLFGTSSPTSSAGGSPDFTDRVADFFAVGAGTKPRQVPGQPPPPEEVECPLVTVREGAATLAIHTPSREQSAMTLRYQGTIGRTARECRIVARTLQTKVGIEGHIILGPAGGPGKLDVPLRLAVVREGPQSVTILTKSYRIPVTIEPGAGNVPFVQIDDALEVPLPANLSELELYVIYVGFDPLSKQREPRRRRAAPRQRS
jgi:hypothetical protein